MNIEAKDRLVQALKPIVEKKGLRAYARAIKVSPSAVTKWTNGDSFPDGDNRDRVAASLGMSLNRFNVEIVRGEKFSDEPTPLNQALRWLETASKSELAALLHAVAEKLEDSGDQLSASVQKK